VRSGPFRRPNLQLRPGEVSLAHNGPLLLDELRRLARNVLELFRQPLEDGSVTITRANMTLWFPSNFMLVAAMNPCPCRHQLTQPHHRREGWGSESAKKLEEEEDLRP
jgi:predicted ATPase with chaperone activity